MRTHLGLICVLVFWLSLPGARAADEGGSLRRWGGSLSVQIPHPVWLDVEHRLTSKWSLALGLGGFAYTTPGSLPISLSIYAFDLRGRWHPFNGSFFLGTALGFQKLGGSATKPITEASLGTIDTTVQVNLNSPYVTPHLGWIFFFGGGFLFGFDFGIQVPFASNTVLSISTDQALINSGLDDLKATAEYQKLESDVTSLGNKIGKLPLPYVTVLRLGWMF